MAAPKHKPGEQPNTPIYTSWAYNLPENEFDKQDAQRLFLEFAATLPSYKQVARNSVSVRSETKANPGSPTFTTTYFVAGRVLLQEWQDSPES